jgi:hypothetical protein
MVKKSLKTKKTENLKTQLQIKDRLIGHLLHVIAENKISLPEHLISILELLYYNKKEKKPDGEENQKENSI